MNNWRVYLTWSDGERTVKWVDAKSAPHACFLIGLEAGQAGMPAEVIVDVVAVLETN